MKPFLPIILILLAIGIFYMYISPHYSAVKNLMDERGQYVAALANIGQVQQLRDSLETQYGNLPQDNINRLNTAIPQGLDTVKLISDLDTVAGQQGMTLSNVQMTSENSDNNQAVNVKNVQPYQTATMSFTVIGTYPGFLSFLKSMENSLQIIDVRAVTMRSSNTKNNLMQFDVTIQTYWIK